MELSFTEFKDWAIVHLKGDFKVSNLIEAKNFLADVEKKDRKKIAFDLSDLKSVDSSSVGLMVNYSKRVFENGGKFAVFGAQKQIYDILNIVSFENSAPLHRDRESFEKSVAEEND